VAVNGFGIPANKSFPLVLNRRGLAVHHAVIHDDLSAEGVADALVSEANAENGNAFPPKCADDIVLTVPIRAASRDRATPECAPASTHEWHRA